MHTPESYSIEVGRVIWMLRLKQSITANHLAHGSGVTISELKEIEAGRFDYSSQVSDSSSALLKICMELGVQPDSLVGFEGDVF